jgi:hypothetical protein
MTSRSAHLPLTRRPRPSAMRVMQPIGGQQSNDHNNRVLTHSTMRRKRTPSFLPRYGGR